MMILAVGVLTGCTLFQAAPAVIFAPQSGHGATSVTITVGDMGTGWSYNLERDSGSKLYATRVFTVTVHPPETLYVAGIHNDGRTTARATIEVTLKNTAPVGYDPFGPLATSLVPGQMYVVDCNYHEWSAGFAWSPPIRAGFIDPEDDPWKITNVVCWYELDGIKYTDAVFMPPGSPGDDEYHVGTDLVPALGYNINNAFIIWPAAVKVWQTDGIRPLPITQLPGYSSPPCGDGMTAYELHWGYIAPGTIYHVDITVEDADGGVRVLKVEKQLTGRADCN